MVVKSGEVQNVGQWLDITVGFIGCGTIATAIVTGICTLEAFPFKSVLLSPRNAQKSKYLHTKFPTMVQIAKDNQAVLDDSDWVFLCVRPQQIQCLDSLTFHKSQMIISVIATIDMVAITKIVAPASKICRVFPVPPVAKHKGITPISPKETSKDVEILFTMLGGAVVVENDEQLASLQAITVLMGPFYQLLHTSALWLQKQNVSSQIAGDYVGSFFNSISVDSLTQGKENGTTGFENLVKEQTPGGLNENAIKELRSSGVYNAVETVLDVATDRLLGKRSLEPDSASSNGPPTKKAKM